VLAVKLDIVRVALFDESNVGFFELDRINQGTEVLRPTAMDTLSRSTLRKSHWAMIFNPMGWETSESRDFIAKILR